MEENRNHRFMWNISTRKMDDFVVIKLQGRIVDTLCEMKPEYKKFVVHKNGKVTLYMQLMKALYHGMDALNLHCCGTNLLLEN